MWQANQTRFKGPGVVNWSVIIILCKEEEKKEKKLFCYHDIFFFYQARCPHQLHTYTREIRVTGFFLIFTHFDF